MGCIKIFAAGSILLLLAGCSGQSGLQQQVDELEKKLTLQASRVNNIESQLKSAQFDLNRANSTLGQMGTTLTAQKDSIDKLELAAKERAISYPDRVAPKATKTKAKAKAKTKVKPKRKKH